MDAKMMGKGWLAAYDGYVRSWLKPVSGSGWDIWWEWCEMNPSPQGSGPEGVRVWREQGVVKVSGEDTAMVRRVVAGQRVAGENWVRARHVAAKRVRKKSDGPAMSVGRVSKERQGVRFRMDAGPVARMRRDLEAARGADVDGEGEGQLPFGDG